MSFTHNSSVKQRTHQKGVKYSKSSSANSVSNATAAVASSLLNAQRAGQQSVQLSAKRCGGLILPILTILRNEGYIQRVETHKEENASKKAGVTVYLRYDGRGQPGIRDIRQISVPSRRLYLPASGLWQPQTTTGRLLLSTTVGVITDREARRQNLGGEVLRRVRLLVAIR